MPQSHYDSTPDPEDMFADTRMSFGDHLEELRSHLIRAGLGFLVCMIFSIYPLGKVVLNWISAPVQHELLEFQKRTSGRRMEELKVALKADEGKLPHSGFMQEMDARPLLAYLRPQLGLDKPQDEVNFDPLNEAFEDLLRDLGMAGAIDRQGLKPSHWVTVPVRMGDPEGYIKALQRIRPYLEPPTMKTFTITETFMVYFKVSLLTGLVISSPWVFWQVWAFIAAGLYPHEKKLVHYYLPFSLGLFLGGALICELFVIPKAIEALLWFNEWLGYDPELRLSDWLGFAIMMPVVFGISFQTPLVMMFLNRVGIIDVATFRNKRRIAWFVMAIFAAIITPTVDAISMLFLWVPMGFLYELGILLCDWQGRSEFEEFESSESEEMVEV